MALAMSELSQTEWRSVVSVRVRQTPCARAGQRQKRTRDTIIPMHLVAVPTAIPIGEVQRLMHIASEMNEELERFLGQHWCCSGRCGADAGAGGSMHKVDQDRADVLDRVEDVDPVLSVPAARAREEAVVRRVITDGTDIVQRRGPARVETDLVSPGGHRREVARRVVSGLVTTTTTTTTTATATATRVREENGADGVQDLGVEVRLGDGGDDLVACFFVLF